MMGGGRYSNQGGLLVIVADCASEGGTAVHRVKPYRLTAKKNLVIIQIDAGLHDPCATISTHRQTNRFLRGISNHLKKVNQFPS